MRSIRPSKLIVYVLLVAFALYMLVPLAWIILSSFKTDMEIYTGVNIPSKWLWENYTGAWQKANMGRFFVNSGVITTLSVILGLLVDILAGYAFAKMALAKHKWLFYIFLIGLAIPLEANVFSIYLQIYSLHLTSNPWGVIIGLVGTSTAFGTFMMRNFFKDLPAFLGESATVDGATELQIFSQIYLPLAGPGISALAIFKLLTAWNEYNLSLFILTKQRSWTIPLAVSIFQQNEFSNYGYIFASTVMSFMPMVLITIIFNRSFIDGIAVGGVKE